MPSSDFGKKMSMPSRMGKLILAVKQAKHQQNPEDVIDLCSGDPRVFPELANLWETCAKDIIDERRLGTTLGTYGDVLGYGKFLDAIVYLFKPYGLQLTHENIFVTPGALSCIFYALNVFSSSNDGRKLNILLPQCPEYQAYAHKGIDSEQFITIKPKIEILDEHTFRYAINLSELELTDVGAILLTRPSNTTGTVLPDYELQTIVSQAAQYNIPVIIDGVYSSPIPDLIYNDSRKIVFDKNVIFLMSFSKAGLAGGRLGVAIGDKDFLKPLRIFQMNLCITMQVFSQMLAARALESGQLQKVLKTNVRPYYQQRFTILKKLFSEYMNPQVPYYFHQVEGGIFQWVWFKDLPISDQELYEKLKSKNVFIMPGNIFFFALKDKSWRHINECIRINLNEPDERIATGIKILAGEVNKLY